MLLSMLLNVKLLNLFLGFFFLKESLPSLDVAALRQPEHRLTLDEDWRQEEGLNGAGVGQQQRLFGLWVNAPSSFTNGSNFAISAQRLKRKHLKIKNILSFTQLPLIVTWMLSPSKMAVTLR